jgi:thiol-disulfide isomerase/thioredoxin
VGFRTRSPFASSPRAQAHPAAWLLQSKAVMSLDPVSDGREKHLRLVPPPNGQLGRTFIPGGPDDAEKKVWAAHFGRGAAALAAVVLAIVVAIGAGGGASGAPNFSFSLYQGVNELGARDLELSRLHNQPVILNFWAGLCPPCRAEMPQFQQFYDEFQDQVTLIGVDIGPFMGLGSHRDAENLLQELGVTYPAGFTNDGNVPRKYSVTGMPTTVFINSGGEVFERRTGAINRNTLVRLTTAMLQAGEASQSATAPHSGS